MSWITTPSQKVPPYADLVFDINVTTTFELRTTSPLCTYVVDWGDRSIETVVNTATVSHTYVNPGAYTVSINVISGVFRPYYNTAASGDLINFVTNRIDGVFSGSLANAFYGSAALQSFQGDLSGVTSLYFAFLDCVSLNSLDIKDKNLSAVTSAGVAFIGTGSINFNGYNLSGLVGSQVFEGGGAGGGLFGWTAASRASKVTSIGTVSEPVILGTTSAANLDIGYFAASCPNLTSVCFDSGARITNIRWAFLDCTALNSFEVLDKNLSKVTFAQLAFLGTGPISFNGFNLSGLVGSQVYAGGIGGVFGWSVASRASKVTSIGTVSEPIILGTTSAANLDIGSFALNCTNLTSVCFDSGYRIVSLRNAFQDCTALNSFEVLDKDLSNVTTALYAFIGTGPISFNGFNLSGLTGAQYQDSIGVFGRVSLSASAVTSIGTLSEPVIFGTTGGNTFTLGYFAMRCTNLAEVCFDSGVKITGSLYRAFNRCTSLTAFNILDKNLSNVTDIRETFHYAGSFRFDGFNLSGLSGPQHEVNLGPFYLSGVLSLGTPSEPLIFGTSSGNTIDIRQFARECTGLTQACFDSGFRINNLNAAFYLCSALTTFTILDAATVGLANITDMGNAFFGCALTAASIENILVACDTGGKTGILLTLNGGTNAGYSTWTATAQAALTSLQAKSWTVTYNA